MNFTLPRERFSSRALRRSVLFALTLVLTVFAVLPRGVHARHQPVVAVAASVAGATAIIAQRFRARTGIEVRLSAGASGNLSRQIQRGAPFELFIAADDAYPRSIVESGLNAGPRKTYAIGQLALLVSTASGIELPSALDANTRRVDAVTRALRDPRLKRIAIANPRHAPYGRAAQQVLRFLGLWPALQAKAVMGESVTQSARFARTDSVQAALLPLGIILHSPLVRDSHLVVPADWYSPLHQQMILIKGASAEAQGLFAFMLGDEARAILETYGFLVPDKVKSVR